MCTGVGALGKQIGRGTGHAKKRTRYKGRAWQPTWPTHGAAGGNGSSSCSTRKRSVPPTKPSAAYRKMAVCAGGSILGG
eukprot:scaffold20823_cov91-Isochrysis_galbana.AAC.3